MGVRESGILVSCSDYHIFKKLNMTRKQALDHYLGIKIRDRGGIRPRCHFEDITRADFYGFVVPFALELRRLSEESGVPIKIRACDTLGWEYHTGSCAPQERAGHHLRPQALCGFPSELIEWHGHNDFTRRS